MALANDQRDGFDRRISRIKKGGANTMGEVHIGPVDEAQVYGKKKGKATNTVRLKKKRKKKVDLNSGATGTLVILAVLFGGLSMFVGQAIDYHLYGVGGLGGLTPPEFAADYVQYAPFFFGGILALAFGWTFRLLQGARFLALIGGFCAVFYYQSELIQTFPSAYAGFFSKAYVEAALAAA
jgi:hypothetical protein